MSNGGVRQLPPLSSSNHTHFYRKKREHHNPLEVLFMNQPLWELYGLPPHHFNMWNNTNYNLFFKKKERYIDNKITRNNLLLNNFLLVEFNGVRYYFLLNIPYFLNVFILFLRKAPPTPRKKKKKKVLSSIYRGGTPPI